MDYTTRLKPSRCRTSAIPGRSFNEEMESDRGRAVNSAALRRLQQKTQVFPLQINAAVRSRLTHSLEVQQVGRHISKIILARLSKAGQLDTLGLHGMEEGFISAVETSCLLHDVGNPPFGHFGEKAINLWAEKVLSREYHRRFAEKREDLLHDLCNFEGNAQGLRILHHLQALNLTHTQLACLLKYTRSAAEEAPERTAPFGYLKKKPGYYLSESQLIKEIAHHVAIGPDCRFPLTYIMEASDDISYCIADIEDAVDKNILTVQRLHQLILSTWRSFKEENPEVIAANYLPKISDKAFTHFTTEEFNKDSAYILGLRTKLVNDLCNYAAQRYIDNHEAVFTGNFNESLLDGSDEYHFATETLRRIALEHVFCTPEVENLELKGYAVISGLLNIYSPLIELDGILFEQLCHNGDLPDHPIESRLFHKLPKKHTEAYSRAVNKLPSSFTAQWEFYHRCRLIIDYISGMTDGFALAEYRNLKAID